MADPITIVAGKSAAAQQMVECNNLYRTLKGKLLALEGVMAQLIGNGAQAVMDQFGTTDTTEAQALADRTSGVCSVFKAKYGETDYTPKVAEFFDPTIY